MKNLLFKKEKSPSDKLQNFLDKNIAPLTQYEFYADWQKAADREIFHFEIVDENQDIVLSMLILPVSISFGKFFLYSPYGPVLDKEFIKNTSDLNQLLETLEIGLVEYMRESKYSFIRLDFSPNIANLGLEKGNFRSKIAPKYSIEGSLFQPRVEWAIDLSKDLETIYQEIDSKNRYAIRLAERKNVSIEIVTENFLEFFEIFYEMMKETAGRNSFGLHKREYYLKIFEQLEKNKNGRLVITKIDGEIASCLVFIDYNVTTMFLLGASKTDLNKKVPTSHYAHYKNIEYSKKAGFKIYNLGGISSEKFKVKHLESLSVFKRRFGGFEIEHSDFYDLVGDKMIYKLFLIKKFIRYLKNILLER